MKKFLLSLMLISSSAYANCSCECVGGQMQAVCSNNFEMKPFCPTTFCPSADYGRQPYQNNIASPMGTSNCQQEQVLNPVTRMYQWQTICR